MGLKTPIQLDGLATLTATEAAALISNGGITVSALADACLDRVASRDSAVQAWTFCDRKLVSAEAARLEAAPSRGPLHGIPVGVKDVIDTADMPTEHNSPLYVGNRPSRDADCVALLRDAGALIFGKTDTVEFAAGGRKARTRNPLDLQRTPGGSSSGSAAAVADHHVPIALGTQSAGSVIRPASYCGIYAMKPSWGTVGRAGVKPYAASLDTVGWMARSLADIRLVAKIFAIARDTSASRDIRAARIAVCGTPSFALAEPSTVAALNQAAALLHVAGADVVTLDLPGEFAGLVDARRTIAAAEGGVAFLADYRSHGQNLHPSIRAMVEDRNAISAERLRSAYDLAARCRERFDAIASEFDAVLTPSAAGEAPIGLAATGETDFNEMWTLLHVPCLNLPGNSGENGLPVGLTLTRPRFTDGELLDIAEPISRCFERSDTTC